MTVLSNILDNAIEACEHLKEEKILKLKIAIENDQLLISAQNPVLEPIKFENNRIVTTKSDKNNHGIGLLNIFTTVEKYNGTYAIQCKDHWFHFTTLIPFQSNS